jgi:hypothetical protein
VPDFKGLVRIAHTNVNTNRSEDKLDKASSASSQSISPIYLSYQGGAIIGVFMMQALKGALWGI